MYVVFCVQVFFKLIFVKWCIQWSPLMRASRRGNDSIVSLLLESKADINYVDCNGVCFE